jgi:lysophospholipase L1-like esterase
MSKKYIFHSFVMISVLILVATLIGLRQATPAHAQATLKIMALGDSITGSPGCWRAILWNKLIANGFTNFQPVGTLSPAGCANDIPNDNHEGHGGFLATGIANNNQLPPWLAATNPDVVLMHLGTNDSFSATNTVTMILAAYTTMVNQMRANNPNMKIYVAQIIPLYTATTQCTDCYQRVIDLNNAIPGWAAGLTTAQSPITVVDQWTGFNTTTDTGDGIHPNDLGIQKMADKWYPAMAALLGGSPLPTPTRTNTTFPITITPTRTFTPTTPPVITNTPTRTPTAGFTPTRTNTPTTGPSLTPTRTYTPTTPPVITNTPTTGVGACSPVTSIVTAPFTWDGAGVYCWQIATIPGYVNNWNNNSVSINGVNFSNVYVAAGSLPAKINNNYYISFNGSYAWSHLEVR